MSKQKSKTPPPVKFKLGDKVRVTQGVCDADYPDMPLGGWVGKVTQIHDDGTCIVRWREETLASIHPVFKKRCEKDGLDFYLYQIGEDELESDARGPLEIDHPTKIINRPLSAKDQDDRIRMIFGLTSNDPLPDVDDDTLTAFQKHLSTKLVFPFTAVHSQEYGHPHRVKVIGLGDPDDEPMIDDVYGILCEARLENQLVTLPLGDLEDPKPNRQLVDDYCYWFHNWS